MICATTSLHKTISDHIRRLRDAGLRPRVIKMSLDEWRLLHPLSLPAAMPMTSISGVPIRLVGKDVWIR